MNIKAINSIKSEAYYLWHFNFTSTVLDIHVHVCEKHQYLKANVH